LNNLFQGAGSPPCFRLLTHWFSPTEIGRAWGIWNARIRPAGAIIAVVAGFLITHYGWRSAFWVPAIVCVVGAGWLMNRLTDSPESMGLRRLRSIARARSRRCPPRGTESFGIFSASNPL